MASVINTNIAATRTHNVYNRNNDYMNQALSRVATGMKINSAKDNASTWAISEKMRERIRANDQANQNVQNDQALLKTAQGGIGNTIDILKTLKERAINAANDSNTNADRARIATEVDQLIKQIDENVEKVKFNGKLLLDGTYADPTETKFEAKPEPGAVTGVSAATSVATSGGAEANASVFNSNAWLYTSLFVHDKSSASASNNTGNATDSTQLVNLLNITSAKTNSAVMDEDHLFQKGDVITLSFTANGEAKENSVTVDKSTTIAQLITGLSGNGVKVQWDNTNSNISGLRTSTDGTVNGSDNIPHTANAFTVYSENPGSSATVTGELIDNLQLSITGEAGERDFSMLISKLGDFTASHYAYKEEEEATAAGLTFYVGGESGFATNVGINAMKASDLGVSSLANSMLEKGTAESAIKTIDDALAKALNEQTKLGSWESRLGYTSDNLTTMNENLEAADSVMRDSDIAKEMTSYMKYAVLSQASQYMLAQAGQNAFQVLNLLQQ